MSGLLASSIHSLASLATELQAPQKLTSAWNRKEGRVHTVSGSVKSCSTSTCRLGYTHSPALTIQQINTFRCSFNSYLLMKEWERMQRPDLMLE